MISNHSDQNRFGLPLASIEKIHAVLQRYTAIEQVIIYGSRAKGTAEAGSDIDLTVIGDDFTPQQLIELEMELDDLLLPYQIDLSRLPEIENRDLVDHIQRVGKPFYRPLNNPAI